MAKARVLKKNDKAYLELPGEVAAYTEMEVFQLKEGYYLLTVPLGKSPEKEKKISESEKAVMKKLLSIRFEKRTPPYVAKVLSEEEKSILGSLIEKGHVNVFKGKKYMNGVYNIKDSIYPLLTGRGRPAAKKQEQPTDPISILNSRGFLIMDDKDQALKLSRQLGEEIKKGSVRGVKGFDGRFYAVTSSYLSSAQEKILAVLKDAMDLDSIATATKLESGACVAVLKLMAEKGEIIEKKKGLFAPV
jgi:hypothetical protein